jgi:PEP-CTERM motif
MTEYTYSVASGSLMVGGDLISRFSIGSVAQDLHQPNGLFVGASATREGAAAEFLTESLRQFRPDGRMLPPGGWLSLTSSNDGMGAGILIARPGELTIREVVPEPSSAVLAGLAAVTLFSRRRSSIV